MKRDHLATGYRDVLMTSLPVMNLSTKHLTVTLSGRKEDTMTIEALEKANELAELIRSNDLRVNALNARMGAGPAGVRIEHIKFSGYKDEEGNSKLPERFCEIPEELGVKIAALLRDYYVKELTTTKEELEAL